jgi:hypothetical protein
MENKFEARPRAAPLKTRFGLLKNTGDKIAGATGPTVPDFRGKSMRSVVEESAASGIDVMIEGSGVARAQAPLPGSPLRQGEQIRIVFTR